MISITAFLLLSTLLCDSAVSTISAQAADHIYWTSSERSELLFVPETVLDRNEQKLGDLRLPKKTKEFLMTSGDTSGQEPASDPTPCAPAVEGDTESSEVPNAVRTPRVLKAVARNEVAFLGRVIDVVPGWLTSYNYPGSSVALEIVEIFTDSDGALRKGQTLRYLQHQGQMRFRGRLYCTSNRAFRAAELGDRVVVAGFFDRLNRGAIETNQHLVFFVVDQLVQPLPDEQFPSPVTLNEVKRVGRIGGSRRSLDRHGDPGAA